MANIITKGVGNNFIPGKVYRATNAIDVSIPVTSWTLVQSLTGIPNGTYKVESAFEASGTNAGSTLYVIISTTNPYTTVYGEVSFTTYQNTWNCPFAIQTIVPVTSNALYLHAYSNLGTWGIGYSPTSLITATAII